MTVERIRRGHGTYCALSVALLGATAGTALGQSADLHERINDSLRLRASQVVEFAPNAAPGEPVLGLLDVDGTIGVLSLTPVSIRAEGYVVLVHGPDGRVEAADPGPVRTLRGEVLGLAPNTVVASMLDDGLHARIRFDDGSERWLEPVGHRVEGAEGLYVVYAGDDVIPVEGTCGSDAAAQIAFADPGPEGGIAGGGLDVAEIACDADYEYFQNWGSVPAVEAQINAIINGINGQYESEVGITHQITAIVVRTSGNDPYKGKNASSILNTFRNEWESNQAGIPRDVAHLFTGRDLSGTTIGIAWLNAVCTSYGYGLVQSDFDSNFACKTDLSAHELGHNWGAGHCSCTSHTMNSYITCANAFNPTITVPAIVGYKNSVGCLNDGGGGAFCGDGNCDPGENACNCPADCGAPPAEICDNGVDDDCDGLTDCADSDCSGDPGCQGGGSSAIVDCITYTTYGGQGGTKHMRVTVSIIDDGGSPVSGASVSMTLSGGGTYNFSGATDGGGDIVFTLSNAANTCYSSDVTNVAASGLTFDGAEPNNGFQKGSDATPDADCIGSNDGCGG